MACAIAMLLRCPALLVFSNKIRILAPTNAVVFCSSKMQRQQGGRAWGCDLKGINGAATVITFYNVKYSIGV
jgi:hypothetical protein